MRKNYFSIFVPSDLDLWLSDLKIISSFTSARSNLPIKYELSTEFQHSVNVSVCDKQTDIYKNNAFSLVKFFRPSTTCVKSTKDHFGLGLMCIGLLFKKICGKIFTLSSPVTFRPQICSPSYSCPVICLHLI